jgi:hypothetical protein
MILYSCFGDERYLEIKKTYLEPLLSGMIIFSYLTDVSYFTLKINSECCRTWSEQIKNGGFERGCR